MGEQIERILSFVALAERLKSELRHSWLSNGRQESVAEHTWMMTLLAIVLHDRLDAPVDLCKTLKMITVHDLVEAVAGDVPSFEQSERKRNKPAREAAAMVELRHLLAADTGAEIAGLWEEFEARTTAEAKFVAAIDNLEVQMQHNLAPFSTWLPIEQDLVYQKVLQPCAYDNFLSGLARAIIGEAEAKMSAAGVNVTALREKHSYPD